MFYCCAVTSQGIREHNEDALLIHRLVLTEGMTESRLTAPFIVAVADGVSGEKGGEIASETCMKMLREINFNSHTDLDRELTGIHERLAQLGAKDDQTRNMQTTLCAVGIDENEELHTVNVGDSRLYRYRNGSLSQLSRDQSLVQMLYEEGSIRHWEMGTHKQRHIIFPVLGNLDSTPIFDIQMHHEKVEYGDILLLCSDGLSDTVSSLEIEEVLSRPKPLVRRLQILRELAQENGSRDNISVLALTRIMTERKR
ncbi:MAG: protein phosphatase 2C domain-containing protein [Oscillospiraceae bacterium]|nr:protein phosphatase 2C domain-containing protein [Oscillospiraceae bacterium]